MVHRKCHAPSRPAAQGRECKDGGMGSDEGRSRGSCKGTFKLNIFFGIYNILFVNEIGYVTEWQSRSSKLDLFIINLLLFTLLKSHTSQINLSPTSLSFLFKENLVFFFFFWLK